jgi:hypothetical protein
MKKLLSLLCVSALMGVLSVACNEPAEPIMPDGTAVSETRAARETPTINGPSAPTIGDWAVFYFNNPSEFTFEKWSVSQPSNGHYVLPYNNLTASSLTVNFVQPGNYTVTAHFIQPGGAKLAVGKSVVASVLPNNVPKVALITYTPSSPQAGSYIYFTAHGDLNGATLEWRAESGIDSSSGYFGTNTWSVRVDDSFADGERIEVGCRARRGNGSWSGWCDVFIYPQ